MLSIRPPIGNIEEFGYITLKFREEAGIDDVNHYKKTITFNKRDSMGFKGNDSFLSSLPLCNSGWWCGFLLVMDKISISPLKFSSYSHLKVL